MRRESVVQQIKKWLYYTFKKIMKKSHIVLDSEQHICYYNVGINGPWLIFKKKKIVKN